MKKALKATPKKRRRKKTMLFFAFKSLPVLIQKHKRMMRDYSFQLFGIKPMRKGEKPWKDEENCLDTPYEYKRRNPGHSA